MRILHSHDPAPEDDRSLTNEEIAEAVRHAHTRMWEYAAMGEFQLAGVCERATDRMLDALAARLSPAS
ncbi:hypothetical protein C8D88_116120 [Lentzea atacamensis]|uniref:Uncharacterized protein n=1 Tax=Lentzea atacamensis TaxID=531938 RepID=A0A316HNX1_9PSEU|nr:hypothetical protein [Lentzea atacamensis]PWK81708.1 hypothetical protein C8D88_116120 [Lentzea atacamensis]